MSTTPVIHAKTTAIIHCPALGFSIPKGTSLEVKHVGPRYSSCKGLGITDIFNDEYEVVQKSS